LEKKSKVAIFELIVEGFTAHSNRPALSDRVRLTIRPNGSPRGSSPGSHRRNPSKLNGNLHLILDRFGLDPPGELPSFGHSFDLRNFLKKNPLGGEAAIKCWTP
jgi:hypothetical protein